MIATELIECRFVLLSSSGVPSGGYSGGPIFMTGNCWEKRAICIPSFPSQRDVGHVHCELRAKCRRDSFRTPLRHQFRNFITTLHIPVQVSLYDE